MEKINTTSNTNNDYFNLAANLARSAARKPVANFYTDAFISAVYKNHGLRNIVDDIASECFDDTGSDFLPAMFAHYLEKEFSSKDGINVYACDDAAIPGLREHIIKQIDWEAVAKEFRLEDYSDCARSFKAGF